MHLSLENPPSVPCICKKYVYRIYTTLSLKDLVNDMVMQRAVEKNFPITPSLSGSQKGVVCIYLAFVN